MKGGINIYHTMGSNHIQSTPLCWFYPAKRTSKTPFYSVTH